MKKLWNRESLKSFFGKGKLPTQVHFEYFIDSTINKLDDGFNRTDTDGLQLSPSSQSNNVLSILKDPVAEHPSWQLSLQNDADGTGLSFNSLEEDSNGKLKSVPVLFLGSDGKAGINSITPKTELEVNGTFTCTTRVGSFQIGKVIGDGNWYDITPKLDGCQAFEVVARIDGPKFKGKYAMTHAIVLLPFGKSRYRIKQTRAYFGWFWNRIELRCIGEVHSFVLQIRTRTHYGPDNHMIKYHITKLWDDTLFNSL